MGVSVCFLVLVHDVDRMPIEKRAQIRAAHSIKRMRASFVAPAMCGVTTQFFRATEDHREPVARWKAHPNPR
jgi:hypothetical protein